MNWYVLFVMGGKEEKICEFFKQENIHAFLPKMEVLYRKQGNFYPKEKLMFPSYVFIESDLEHTAFHQKLLDVKQKKKGIIKELKFDDEGTPALTQEEKELIEKLIGRSKVMKHSIGYIEGDQVIVTDDPLQGLESKIIKIDRHKRRALIEIEMLGRIVNLNVSLEIIKKIGL